MYNKALDMKQYVCLVLLIFIISGSTTVPYSYMVQKHMTWYSAVESCNNKEGILLDDTEIKDFVSSELVSTDLEFEDDWRNLESQEYWIKQYKYKSPWISAKGCFSGSSSDSSSASTFQRNTVGTCYQRCSHSDYFALQGNTCKCFSETEFRKLREENGEMCNVTCSGDEKHRCGGAGVYDVYQTTDIHPEPEPNCQQSQDCDCVGLQCDDSKPVYFSDYCQENHSSGCAIRGSLFIGPMGDWSTSFNTCVSLTGKYPLLTSDKIQLSSLCGNNVWIGVFRLTLVSKDTIKCPYCTVDGINRTEFICNVTDCHSNRKSICRYSIAIWPYLFSFLVIPLVLGVCFYSRSGTARIRDNRSDLSQQHSHSNIATGEDVYDLARPMQYDMDSEFNEDNYNHLQRNTPIWGSDVMIAQDHDVSIPTVSGHVHDHKMETANISNAIYEEYHIDMIK